MFGFKVIKNRQKNDLQYCVNVLLTVVTSSVRIIVHSHPGASGALVDQDIATTE